MQIETIGLFIGLAVIVIEAIVLFRLHSHMERLVGLTTKLDDHISKMDSHVEAMDRHVEKMDDQVIEINQHVCSISEKKKR